MKDKNKEMWTQAMKEEISSVKRNQTWELVTLPADRKAIGCKWLFKIKPNENGHIDRFKARLVAHGLDFPRYLELIMIKLLHQQ